MTSMSRKRYKYVSFGLTITIIALMVNINTISQWTKSIADRTTIEYHTMTGAQYFLKPKVISTQLQKQWSDIKLVLYMTSHLSVEHILFFPCWYDAITRLDIFKYADLILYVASQPTIAQLDMLPFQNIIIKLYNNTYKQEGAIQAMIDPFIENSSTWFDEYDWVIRLNPDVLIRNDTWLIQTMMDTSYDGIFHECCESQNYSNPNPKLHTDFYEFRPSVVNRYLVLNAPRDNTEYHMTSALRNIYDSKRFAFVQGATNGRRCLCRIQGVNSPIVHSHDLWRFCPNYYDIHNKNSY